MSATSTIEWTNATWNPVRGCALVSPGCTNCYAMRQAHRFSGPGGHYYGLTKPSNGGPVWTGDVRYHVELLSLPRHWRKPRRVFVNSMSDLFHPGVPDDFIVSVFAIMAMCPQHTFQILTKRPERMAALFAARGADSFWIDVDNALELTSIDLKWPLPNVWLGVSVEDQARADERIPLLLQTPAAVRWISAEPLLEPVSLLEYLYRNLQPTPETRTYKGRRQMKLTHEGRRGDLHWVVAGGESGPSARPTAIANIRSLVQQCKAAGVAVFVKQLGRQVSVRNDSMEDWPDEDAFSDAIPDDYEPAYQGEQVCIRLKDSAGADPAEWPEDLRVREFPA